MTTSYLVSLILCELTYVSTKFNLDILFDTHISTTWVLDTSLSLMEQLLVFIEMAKCNRMFGSDMNDHNRDT